MMTEIILKMTHPLQTRLADGLGAEGCPVARYGAIRPKSWVPRSPVLREIRRVTAFAIHWNQESLVRQGGGRRPGGLPEIIPCALG